MNVLRKTPDKQDLKIRLGNLERATSENKSEDTIPHSRKILIRTVRKFSTRNHMFVRFYTFLLNLAPLLILGHVFQQCGSMLKAKNVEGSKRLKYIFIICLAM